jgi:hypothetical protein
MDSERQIFYSNLGSLKCKKCRAIGRFRDIKSDGLSYCGGCGYRPLLNTLLYDNKLVEVKIRRNLSSIESNPVDNITELRNEIARLSFKQDRLKDEIDRLASLLESLVNDTASSSETDADADGATGGE